MANVSSLRLYLLRALYLLIAVGLGVQMWPAIIFHIGGMMLPRGILTCMLWALSVLAVVQTTQATAHTVTTLNGANKIFP